MRVDFVELPILVMLPDAKEQKYLRVLGLRFEVFVKSADSILPIFSTIAFRKFAPVRFVPANSIKINLAAVRLA